MAIDNKKIKKIILASGQCSWKKCFACGWGQLKAPVDVDFLRKRVESESYEGYETVKIFVSGSFLDDAQFPKQFRQWLADFLKKKGIRKLVVESRPEFVTQDNLNDFKEFDFSVGIGLECADNEVLKKYEKGFTVEGYLKAVELLHKNSMHARTYLMVNIPFGSIELLDKSVEFVESRSKEGDSLVLINTFPHSKSKLFNYWIEGKWKPLSTKKFDEIVSKHVKKYNNIETDSQNYLFVPKFPPEMKKLLKGANSEILNHRFFEVWQDYFQRFYEKPKGKTQALFLQCSFKKPYSRSKTHKAISKVLNEFPDFVSKTHLIVLSTPGVIPMEFDNYYPFNAYDWPEWEETPEIKKEYVEVISRRIKNYLKAHKYEKYFSYLKPSSETYQALKKACIELGIKLTNLFDESVYEQVKNEKNPVATKIALGNLKKRISLLNEE